MPIGTQKALSARTVEEFGQSLASLHVSHLPVLYIQVLAVRCLLHTQLPGVTKESVGLSLDAYRHSDSTQRDPSARTAGDFRQSLVFLHVSHSPALYILVLAVQYLLHTQPPGVTVESAGLSLDAYRHSDSTQRDPSARIAGDFRQSLAFLHACLASASALHTSAGSGVSSAHMALRCAWGV